MFRQEIESTTCVRCELEYPTRNQQCHHCVGLDDIDASTLKSRMRNKLETQNSKLSRQMIIGFVIVVNVILVALLIV